MSCTFSKQILDQTITFHGHSCPGLAIGIRAAEYAQSLFPDTEPSKLVCVTETDMCGVDAIQFLTDCTFGKGNLIHLDYGKMAFSFYDRAKEGGARLVYNLMNTDESREEMITRIMGGQLEELFSMEKLEIGPPKPARVLEGLICEACDERTMESRTRRLGGQTLCIPCFNNIEQKV